MNINKMETVNNFLSKKRLAVVGFSRTGNKMGNSIYNELSEKGYELYPVNKAGGEVKGVKIYRDYSELPEKPEGAIIAVNETDSLQAVKDAREAGISSVWIQRHGYSEEAYQYCVDNKMNVVAGECVLMFAEPTMFIHKIHRGINRMFGKLPQ